MAVRYHDDTWDAIAAERAIIGRCRLVPHRSGSPPEGGLLPDAVAALDLPYVQGGVKFIYQ